MYNLSTDSDFFVWYAQLQSFCSAKQIAYCLLHGKIK